MTAPRDLFVPCSARGFGGKPPEPRPRSLASAAALRAKADGSLGMTEGEGGLVAIRAPRVSRYPVLVGRRSGRGLYPSRGGHIADSLAAVTKARRSATWEAERFQRSARAARPTCRCRVAAGQNPRFARRSCGLGYESVPCETGSPLPRVSLPPLAPGPANPRHALARGKAFAEGKIGVS